MFQQSRYRHEFAEIERRMQHLERRFERLGGVARRTAAGGLSSAAQATDRVGDALVAALGELVDRFRGGARSFGGEATRFGQEAARFGQEWSGDAVRRVSQEVAQRPLVTLAIAAGIGILIGLAGRRN